MAFTGTILQAAPAFSTAGTNKPTQPIPTGAANGDLLIAELVYSGQEVVTPPAGWNVAMNVAMSTNGTYQAIWRTMAAGVTAAQWTIADSDGDALWAKFDSAMIAVRGGSAVTAGAPYNRSASGLTSVIGGVTVPTDGLLVLLAGDRTGATAQSSVTKPASMTEQVKNIMTGGGAASVLIATEIPAAGASGTRTVTYGLASANAAGILLAIAPAATTAAPTVTATPTTAKIKVGATQKLIATVTGTATGSWTMVSGPPAAQVTPPAITSATSPTLATVAPSVAGTYVFAYTATNTSGSDSDTLVLTVSDTTARPIAVVSNPGNWAAVGADSIELGLADTSDTTYAEAAGTSGQSFTVQVSALDVLTQESFRVRARSTVAPTQTLTVTLNQGSTVIATRTQALTTTLTTYTFALTSGELAALTNGADLRVTVTVQ